MTMNTSSEKPALKSVNMYHFHLLKIFCFHQRTPQDVADERQFMNITEAFLENSISETNTVVKITSTTAVLNLNYPDPLTICERLDPGFFLVPRAPWLLSSLLTWPILSLCKSKDKHTLLLSSVASQFGLKVVD